MILVKSNESFQKTSATMIYKSINAPFHDKRTYSKEEGKVWHHEREASDPFFQSSISLFTSVVLNHEEPE